MRRVRFHAYGGPEVLEIEEAGIPEPGPGQVLIKPEIIGANYVDVQIRRETDPGSIYHRPLPATLTGDVVGVVERAGRGVDPALVGARVAALSEDAMADYVTADAAWLIPLPGDADAVSAVMLPTVASVAMGVLNAGRTSAGDSVLITAAAGGVGHLAVQLARHRGAGTIIATAGSAAKLAFLKELGADVVVDHTAQDWAEQVRQAVPGGVDVALDAIGGHTLHAAIGLLAPGGRAVAYGAASGDLTSVPVGSLFMLRSLTGFAIMALRATDEAQARADLAELTALVTSGELYGTAGLTLPLAEIVRAHRELEARSFPGRLILVP
ncbi:zinc-binding dehydrogenase [Nonomuraea sp. NBC_01738]|uniref:quinone oxidoreductase family protein n=1 Tax=Nonomuraea sp. NBC_01738 TaxID=2976003 RepID=UPI002E133C9C|nr:zinc-binding dehydrogenase [Nonomuraea sp. NBC_01738]